MSLDLPRFFWGGFGSQKQLVGQEEPPCQMLPQAQPAQSSYLVPSPQPPHTGEHAHTLCLWIRMGVVCPLPCWQVDKDRSTPLPVSVPFQAQVQGYKSLPASHHHLLLQGSWLPSLLAQAALELEHAALLSQKKKKKSSEPGLPLLVPLSSPAPLKHSCSSYFSAAPPQPSPS